MARFPGSPTPKWANWKIIISSYHPFFNSRICNRSSCRIKSSSYGKVQLFDYILSQTYSTVPKKISFPPSQKKNVFQIFPLGWLTGIEKIVHVHIGVTSLSTNFLQSWLMRRVRVMGRILRPHHHSLREMPTWWSRVFVLPITWTDARINGAESGDGVGEPALWWGGFENSPHDSVDGVSTPSRQWWGGHVNPPHRTSIGANEVIQTVIRNSNVDSAWIPGKKYFNWNFAISLNYPFTRNQEPAPHQDQWKMSKFSS